MPNPTGPASARPESDDGPNDVGVLRLGRVELAGVDDHLVVRVDGEVMAVAKLDDVAAALVGWSGSWAELLERLDETR